MTWTELSSEFDWDGSWRDVYVRHTTIEDWENVLKALRQLTPAPSFQINGEIQPWPLRVQDVFEPAAVGAALLSVQTGPVLLNCHFFDLSEIEFDLDPREVRGPEDFESLKEFMTLLATTTGKPAILTPENGRDFAILTIDP